MSVSQLRQLVRQYAAQQLSYAQFREQFVSQYLAVAHADSLLNKVVALIESACADFSEAMCDEVGLRLRVSSIIPERVAIAETESLTMEYVDIVHFAHQADVVPFTGTADVNVIATPWAPLNSPVVIAQARPAGRAR